MGTSGFPKRFVTVIADFSKTNRNKKFLRRGVFKKYFKISQKLRSKYLKTWSGRIESLNLMFFTLKYIPISGEIVPLRSLWEEVGGLKLNNEVPVMNS
jgi:hypothetical protein